MGSDKQKDRNSLYYLNGGREYLTKEEKIVKVRNQLIKQAYDQQLTIRDLTNIFNVKKSQISSILSN